MGEFVRRVVEGVERGGRFAGLIASSTGEGTRLIATVAHGGELDVEQTVVTDHPEGYPSIAARVPAARWYEREIRDLFGLAARGDGSLEALVFPAAHDADRPYVGDTRSAAPVPLDLTPPALVVAGEGVFTMSYGPVRSGVFESIEYVLETPGEDIPYLDTRVFYKHRGVETRFEGRSAREGTLVAERCEGVASVAHAMAYCGALERIGVVAISPEACFVRVIHAELERIANHLDSSIRHTEAAGQAVAYSRLSLHKETLQRLRARLCGSRFGRGVVQPGGVTGPPGLRAGELRSALDTLRTDLERDTKLLMNTPSFLDRLRGTGVLPTEIIGRFGALGPLARGSGVMEDLRSSRPYAAYEELGYRLLEASEDGDALARQRVRLGEIEGAFALIDSAIDQLDARGEPKAAQWSLPLPALDGEGFGWSEAPQGELLTWVEIRDGVLVRVKPRSASFHNLALFPMAFPRDILTDFAFIEASFGLSIAGVAS